MSKTIVACVEDLFFRSKIEATARHLNVPVRFTDVRSLAKTLQEAPPAALLIELSSNGETLAAIRKLREAGETRELPIVGFLSHVDRQLARDAESAGVTRVMARSQFSETLPDLVMDLLAPGTKREIPEEPELPDE
jgi:DNA-binding NarL/FixJ family response regulator